MSDEKLKIQLMYDFRNQLLRFLDELIEQFPLETDFILIRVFMRDQVPVYDVLGRFIRDLLPHRKQVEDRNVQYFLNNTILYNGIANNKVNHFQELWKSDKLDDDDREIIWRWMDSLNTIGDQYFKKFGYVSGWEPVQQQPLKSMNEKKNE